MATTTTIDNTEIEYDRLTKDYAVLVDGIAVAYGRNYSEAEAKRTAYLADRDADLGNVDCASWSTAPTATADPPPDDAPGHDEDGVPHALLIDIARTLDMALGHTHGNASIVTELRRVRARVQETLGIYHTV